jgi:hypothetical protein
MITFAAPATTRSFHSSYHCRELGDEATMETGQMEIRLRCLLIDTELKVLLDPFWLTVPLQGHQGLIFTFLRSATPSLRGVSDSRFSLYEPLAIISSRKLTRLTEVEVDLGAPWK